MLGRILAALGGLVVLALFAALIAPYFIDWSSLRPGIEEQASRILGRKVSVEGAVDVRILPLPSVTLQDVRVGRNEDGEAQLEAARFAMDMELAPLLSGEVHIFGMRIEAPKARIRVLADGSLDWMRGSRAVIAQRHVVIEDVAVSDGEIEIIDEKSGLTRRITGLSGTFSADSLAGPWRGEGQAALDGHEAAFSLTSGMADGAARRMALKLRLLPEAYPVEVNLDGALALAEDGPGYGGSFGLQFLQEEDETEPPVAPPPGPRIRGDFTLTKDAVRIGQYRLELGATDNPYVVTGEARLDTGEKPQFLLIADGQQIDINRLGEGVLAKTGRNAAISAQKRINAFLDAAARVPIPQVPGRASLKLPALVVNDTTVRDIRLDLRPAGRGWAVDDFQATLPGRTQLEAKGNLTLRDRVAFSGDLLVASKQPSGLSDWLAGSVAPEIRALDSAGFSARVDLTAELQRFEALELALGPAVMKGRLERQALAGQVPGLSLNLAGNSIDIDALRALGSLLTGDDVGRHLAAHRIAAALKADRFTAFGVAAEKVDTVFSVAAGAINLERLSIGNIEGASVAASGRAEGSLQSPVGSGSLRLRSEEPSALLAMLRDRLPPHPLTARLAEAGGHFADTDLAADLTLGSGKGLSVKVNGRANGSAVSAELALPGLFSAGAKAAIDLTAMLENPDSRLLLAQAGLDPLPLPGDGAGRLRLQVSQPGEGLADTALSFATEKTTFDFKGDLDLGRGSFGAGSGHVVLRSDDLEPYLLMKAVALPQMGVGLPARLEADIAVTPEAVRLSNLEGAVADNGFSGALDLGRGAAVLPVSGGLNLDRLDLAWLGEALFGPVADAQGGLSAAPLTPSALGNTDISLDVKAGNFDAGDLGSMRDFSAKIAYRLGGLTIEDAAAAWSGGTLSGRLMLSNVDGAGLAQVRLAVEGADLAPLVWQRDGAPVARGSLGFDVSVESSGRSFAELAGGAGGSAELRLRQLAVEGISADALAPLMAGFDQAGSEVSEERVRSAAAALIHDGRLALGDIAVPVTIAAGEARVQTVSASAGAARLSGEGRFDPLRERIDAVIAVSYDAGEEAVAGGDPTLRLHYSGELARPQMRLDAASMANFLSQRAFERERRRVETLQASVMEKQRLRREVALYQSLERERQATWEKAAAAEQARRAAAEKARAEREAARRLREQLLQPLAPAAPAGTDFFPPAPSPPAGVTP